MRKENWPEILAAFLDKEHTFDWASCNCVLFSSDAVLEMTGTDFAKSYRRIKTKRGMLTKLGREYGGDVCNAATDKLGPPIDVRTAKRGDVVAMIISGENVLGICCGLSSVFISENDGLIFSPTGQCISAWTI